METGGEHDDQERQLSSRSENADRALRTAVFGLLLWPLQLYAAWLLLKVFFANEELVAKSRRNGILAGAITVPFLVMAFLVPASFLGFFPFPDNSIDPKGLPQPLVMSGRWQSRDNIDLLLKLNGTFRLHIQEATDHSGSWGFKDRQLFLHIDEVHKGARKALGKYHIWPLERFSDNEMVLDMDGLPVKFTRTE